MWSGVELPTIFFCWRRVKSEWYAMMIGLMNVDSSILDARPCL